MTKSELRKIYLVRQNNLSPTERRESSGKIAGLLFDNFDLSIIKFLHCFIPIKKFSEIDTRFIFERLWEGLPHIESLVPRVNLDSGEIEHLKFTSATTLIQNIWEIHEPFDNEFVDTKLIDMVLVPGLAFDRSGHRVGYGKGFYDRFLTNCREDCKKIGLSYFAPVPEIADIYDGDIRLDFLITPETIFSFGHNHHF